MIGSFIIAFDFTKLHLLDPLDSTCELITKLHKIEKENT